MKISVLERLLYVERLRPKALDVGVFAPPVAMQFSSGPEEGPWITTLSNGSFTLTRRDREGRVGQAMFECPVEEEDTVLRSLYEALWRTSIAHGWQNRCTSIEEASKRLVSFGLEPKALTVPYSTLKIVLGEELTEEEVEKLTFTKGCVAETEGVQVFSARKALPPGSAILSAHRPLVGRYTRAHDYLGVTLFKANQAMVLVNAVA